MKLLILISTVIGLVVGRTDVSYYVSEDDYLSYVYQDIEAVIADVASLHAYCDCFLDRGHCTWLAQSFKDIIEDSVINACDRCNEPQKEQYGRFLQAMKEKLPEDYKSFRQKYDPKNMYFDALEAEICKS